MFGGFKNCIYICIVNQHTNTMKKWTVTIEAQDEASALVYLDMLRSSFRASILMKLPMESTVIDDPAKGEKLVCSPSKNIWSWLRKG